MIKRRRTPDRSRRRRTRATLSDGRVKVSIATTARTGRYGDLDGALSGDVELAKAAVLYADEVEMIGLGVSMLKPYAIAPRGPLDWFLDLDDEALAEIDARSGKQREYPEGWRDLLRTFDAIDDTTLQRVSPELQAQVLTLRAQMEEIASGVQEHVKTTFEPTGLYELIPAIDARVVTIAELGVSASSLWRSEDVTKAQNSAHLQLWLDTLLERLEDRSVRLLFDEESGSLIQRMIDESEIEPSGQNLRLAAQAALGAGFVARLPAFTAAPMDELLDLRGGLAVPLTSYRGAIIRFSKELPQVLGSGLDFEVAQLWEETVAPAIVELEDQLAQHSLVREMARSANAADIIDFGAWTATTAFAVGSASDLGVVVSALVGAGTGGLKSGFQLGVDALRQRGQARKAAEKSEFYMLYRAKAHLRDHR